MSLASWSTANYLRRLSLVYDTYPYMVSLWFYASGTPNDDHVINIGTSGSADQIRAGFRCSGTNFNMQGYRRTTATTANTSFVISGSTWYHAGLEVVGANDFSHLINGANKQSSSTNLTITASNSVTIGVSPALTAASQWPGYIAEVSIWGGAMSGANMDSLAAKLYNGGAAGAGGNPLNITAESSQPWSGQLKAYWIDSANTITDLSGNGHDLTMTGTLTNPSNHPTIEAVSAGGGGKIAALMATGHF